MPTVPSFQGGGFQSPSGPTPGAIAGEQASAFGRAAISTGDAIGKIAMDMANEANQVRINDAVNQARIAAQDLTYNPQSGFLQMKGASAFLDEEGKPLGQDITEVYGGKLALRLGEISQSLGNDQQKQAFRMRAQDLASQFHGQVESHLASQFNTYHDATDEATVKLALQSAALDWNKPDAIFGKQGPDGSRQGGAIDQAKAAIYSKAKRAGLVGAPFDAAVLSGVSTIHSNVIAAALENSNPSYALGYLDEARKRGEMSGTDILKLQGHINQAVVVQMSQTAVQRATTRAMPAIAPTGFDKMAQITAMTESGGRETNPDGSTVTSPKGALGIMQVMPATAASPGFGMKPLPANATPEDRAQFGRDYLQNMLQKYGDPAKAWAAYNAGPGRLDQALKESAAGRSGSGDWLTYMPKETQSYVAKNMAALQKAGAIERPTEMDFVNTALSSLPAGAPANAIKATRDAAVAQYGIITKTLNEKGENALAAAQRWAIETGALTTAQMPADIRDEITRYAPGKMDDIDRFIKARGDVPTDWSTYTNLRALAATQPAKFVTTDLRQSYHLLAPPQREQLLDLQMKAKEPNGAAEVATLSQQLGTAHSMLGFKTGDAEKKGKFDDAVTQALAAEKREKARALTFEERDKVIKRMMLQTSGGSWFSSSRRVYEVSGTPEESSRQPKISDDDRKLITAALTSEKLPITEENIAARFKLRYGIK